MTTHDFGQQLAWSHRHPIPNSLYHRAFPEVRRIHNMDNDMAAQYARVDRVLETWSGRTINVNEKVRKTDFPDIALEVFTDYDAKRPGWCHPLKTAATDWIAYAVPRLAVCYLLPCPEIRHALLNQNWWWATYPEDRYIIGSEQGVAYGEYFSCAGDCFTGHPRAFKVTL